ncbi:MAG: HlyC/CorC family transporter [Alphaproteobacteria bacterium]|nr:HlyC/CorC family transporter [Alphaproteobacteria bacterium]
MESDIQFVISFFGILILMVLSAFFSGSETALTAASRVRLLSREKEGNKRAAMVNRIREHKDRMIGALLLGNNLVNIMASALATSVLIKAFGEAGVIYATFIMTLLVLIFAEVLPKTYAFHHAETLSMRIAPVVRMVIVIFAPVTETVTWIVRRVLKLFGIDISKVMAGSHLELLRGAIEMHEGPEQETQDQRAMLRSILDLADVEIAEIMVHRKSVMSIEMDQPIPQLVEEVLNSPYTRLPLWKDNPDNIVGVLHVKQLLCELRDVGGDFEKVNVRRISMEPWFVPETTNLYDQLQAFRQRREHFALVVDEYGAFMGIVTLEDILEEIVGEIDDEHDTPGVQGVRRLANGSYIIDGTVTIRDLNRELDWGLPDEDYATLAGLILYESQMVPQAGQAFVFHGYRFDVVRRQRNQITLIRVTPLEDDGAAEEV